jgi:hypothetical protein
MSPRFVKLASHKNTILLLYPSNGKYSNQHQAWVVLALDPQAVDAFGNRTLSDLSGLFSDDNPLISEKKSAQIAQSVVSERTHCY